MFLKVVRLDMIIYHDNDNDGKVSAWVLEQRFGKADKRLADRQGKGLVPEELAGEVVFVVDMAFTEEVCERLAAVVKRLVVIDHHESSKWLKGKPYGVWNDKASACGLTWSYCYGEKDVPALVQYVQDRDIWTKELECCDGVNLYISTLDDYGEFRLKTALEVGSVLEAVHRRRCKDLAARATECEFFDHVVPVVNVMHMYTSDVVGQLAEGYRFAVGFQLIGEQWIYNLRSRGEFNVAAIAVKNGGGGHFHAAGFESDCKLHYPR